MGLLAASSRGGSGLIFLLVIGVVASLPESDSRGVVTIAVTKTA